MYGWKSQTPLDRKEEKYHVKEMTRRMLVIFNVNINMLHILHVILSINSVFPPHVTLNLYRKKEEKELVCSSQEDPCRHATIEKKNETFHVNRKLLNYYTKKNLLLRWHFLWQQFKTEIPTFRFTWLLSVEAQANVIFL